MGRLSGKVAIITGAASGMGEAAAKLFASEGAQVVATDRTVDALQAVVKSITDAGGDAIAVEIPVASPESWANVADQAIAKYGHIDVLCNNAGVHWVTGILDETVDKWNKMLAINLTGVWLGMKTVIPHMQKQGKGSIINTSCIAGILGGAADGGGAAYSAAKGGVRSLTKHAAQNFAADSIRVNSVHPGAILTGMARAFGLQSVEEMAAAMGADTPLPPHAGEPNDIAYGYLYLASDESKFVTGEELIIDGGWVTH